MLARLPSERLTAAFWFISLLAVVIGRQKRTPSDALTGTVVIKPIKGTGWLAARP